MAIEPHLRARTRLLPIALSALAAAAVACSLTTSLDGLTTEVAGDAASTPQPDGGPSPDVEGGPSGDAVAGDGGVDAAQKPFLCSDHGDAVYCADFEGTPITIGWTHVNALAGGVLTGGAGRFGQGLSAFTPSHDTSTRPEAWLESSGLTIPPRQDFTFSIDMNIGSLKGGQTDFVGFGFHGPFYILTLRGEGDGKVDLYEYGDPIGDASPELDHYQSLLVQPALGIWIHVVGHVTFGSSSVHLKMTFDDAVAFDGELGAFPYAGHPYAHAGISQTTGDGNPTTILFDDVLVTSP